MPPALAIYAPIFPEIFLALAAMALLMYGVFGGDRESEVPGWLAVLILAATGALVLMQAPGAVQLFDGAVIVDDFARFMKLLILGGSGFALILSFDYLRDAKILKFEFPVIALLSTVGMMLMASANNLISLYMALELQSLALYVLCAFRRDSVLSAEAGLKYFVLGALSSGLLLYGCSLVYGFTGTMSFAGIASVLQTSGSNIGLVFGLVFILCGVAFKLSAVPFHMWTPDVYQGAPTPVTAFLAAAPKVAAFAMLIRLVEDAFPAVATDWKQIVIAVSVGSMLLGAFAAIGQTNIKRLMAYSSIGHVGYALVGIAAGTPEGVKGVMIYLAIYVVMTLGTFACILAMRRKGGHVEDIAELSGLSRHQPMLAFMLAMLLFSMAGIPPLAGFFAKYFVFTAAIQAGLFWLAVLGVLTSVVSTFYYLAIISKMYFQEPAANFEPMPGKLRFVLAVTGVITLFLFIPINLLVTAAEAAARSLF
ncbi:MULTISPECIES: NADH-quinone oxidoreductase subunit NuoN [Rhodomicrobium]|uniref:NADH-quinone oxidoreductase subunit NuoN n=1 Tax=Rhodomicrobium TaxID=1068 RepID=UPI000B4AB965|nr:MULTISPECIES: NADH-quinone oxidoreductase subunit NuoN [Rhodomicrobium]